MIQMDNGKKQRRNRLLLATFSDWHVRFLAESGKKYSDAREPPFFGGFVTFLHRHVSSPP
jgi:hypothetical protein